jgi:hypothetical protein
MTNSDRFYQQIREYRKGIVCKCGKRKFSGAKKCHECYRKKRNGNLSRNLKYHPIRKEYYGRHSKIWEEEKRAEPLN